MTRSALIAIGGNALVIDGDHTTLDDQRLRASELAEHIATLIEGGWRVLITHGNGPQVGFILRRGELAGHQGAEEKLPALPLWLAVADSQGGIGHILGLALDNALLARGLDRRVAAVLTHTEIDPDDPAFVNPTKPIGSELSAQQAEVGRIEHGWHVRESADGTYRRVVGSPQPKAVLETDSIRTLIDSGHIVIAAGGGGIPVRRDAAGWIPVDAVIDKDRASALLAAAAGLAELVLVTGVDNVAVRFGTPQQRSLHNVTADEMVRYQAAGEFPPGSMGPKVEAALRFLENGGRAAVICSITGIADALEGRGGTRITTN